MSRQKRLHVAHATYYVVDRFAPGLEILVARPNRPHTLKELDQIALNRRHFEEQLTGAATRWGAHIDAHCWLPDAALLVLQVSLASLECILHSLHGTYSHYLRSTAGLRERPFPGRYHALLLDPDHYLLDFARHVVTAPVRDGITPSALNYPHSSLRMWAEEMRPRFLAHSRIPAALTRRHVVARSRLEQLLLEPPRPDFPSLLLHGSSLDNRIAGSERFVRSIQRKAHEGRPTAYIEAAMRWAANLRGVELSVLTDPKRSRTKALVRALAGWLITCSGAASLSETARALPCRKSTLHEAIEHHAPLHPELFNETTLSRYLEFLRTLAP